MALLALGINHKTASVDIREKVAFSPDHIDDALKQLLTISHIKEASILSTCNRTELYCASELEGSRALLDWLGDFHGIPVEELAACSYAYWDEDAVNHMMSVACGLDSLVLGEPQILGQLKSAYATSREAGTVNGILGRLFESTFSVAKRVRTHTSIGENPVSVAFAAVSLASRLFSDFSNKRALLIGAGKTVELVARHLREAGVNHITVANRTLSRAEALAQEFNGTSILLSDIPDHLPNADIVIASTASQLPVLGKGAVERALKIRKRQPIFMVDIAVPRDIEPQVAELDDVFLYTVDDLKQVIDKNIKSREGAAEEARHLIESGAAEFIMQLRALNASTVLKQFRGKAEQLKGIELERALKAIRKGGDPEQVLQAFANGLTNKLIHSPTVQVRKATSQGRFEAMNWLEELYELGPSESGLPESRS
jgi:glutamyl-tRNA reductase